MVDLDASHYYLELAAAWVRGVEPALVRSSDDATCEAAIAAGHRIHRFKRMAQLPRVRKVLGMLRGFAPSSLLDIGTGRGAFLWPLLDELPSVSVTCVDVLDHRVSDIEAVRKGGVDRVRAIKGDAASIDLGTSSFDVVTALEVLEHVEDPHAVARNLLRYATRALIVTVPSKPDDNPEHVRLFDKKSLEALFPSARRIAIDGVLDHFVMTVQP